MRNENRAKRTCAAYMHNNHNLQQHIEVFSQQPPLRAAKSQVRILMATQVDS